MLVHGELGRNVKKFRNFDRQLYSVLYIANTMTQLQLVIIVIPVDYFSNAIAL